MTNDLANDTEIQAWINYQLNALGFPLVSKKENLKIVYNLLLVVDKETKYSMNLAQDLKILEKQKRELEDENSSLVKKRTNLLQKLDVLEGSVQETILKFQNEKSENVKLKEEISSLKKSLHSLKSLHNHETRGKSIQIDQLKDLINQKLNSLARTQIKENFKAKFSKKTDFIDKDSKDELDFLFSNYQEREGELIKENLKVKEFLFDILCLFKQEFGIQDVSLAKNQFEMPLEMIKENIDSKLKLLMAGIKEGCVLREEGCEIQNMKKELEEKRMESSILKKQLQESNEILELLVKQEKNPNISREMDGTMEEIELQKKELENARMLLDQERKQFTEAAVRMGIERAALQKEKELLQENKRQVETEELLKQMPTTPFWMKKSVPVDFESIPESGPLTKSTPLQDSTQDLIDTLSKLEAPEFVMESDTIRLETPCQNRSRGILKSAIKKQSPGTEIKSVRIKEEI